MKITRRIRRIIIVGATPCGCPNNVPITSCGCPNNIICTQNRKCLFGENVNGKIMLNDAGKMVQIVWDEMPKYSVCIETDEFIVMPNHRGLRKLWQRNYYEHIIRNENELNRIREYITNNPVNWKTDKHYIG